MVSVKNELFDQKYIFSDKKYDFKTVPLVHFNSTFLAMLVEH